MKISSKDQEAKVNQMIEDQNLEDLQNVLDSLEVEELCLSSKIESLETSLNKVEPLLLDKIHQLILLQESDNSVNLSDLEMKLNSLTHLQELDQHFTRMGLFLKYSALTSQFLEFREEVQNPKINSCSKQDFLKFVIENKFFFEQLNNTDSDVNLTLFESRIRTCYEELFEAFQKNELKSDIQIITQILTYWPLDNENSKLKTKILSVCLKDFPNNNMKFSDYIGFIEKVREALTFLKSLEPVLKCDLLTINSLLVSLKAYEFESGDFQSLNRLSPYSELFKDLVDIFSNVSDAKTQFPLLIKSLFYPYIKFLGSFSKKILKINSSDLFINNLFLNLQEAVNLIRYHISLGFPILSFETVVNYN